MGPMSMSFLNINLAILPKTWKNVISLDCSYLVKAPLTQLQD